MQFNNNLFRLSSYRKNYRKRKVGNTLLYVSLDFAYLKDLAIIDMNLRTVLSKMSLDIEHYAKMQLLSIFEANKEDGYAIVTDYFNNLSVERKDKLLNELSQSKSSLYCKDLYYKYLSDTKNIILPVWVFIELVPFGSLIDFYKFCGEKKNDKTMLNNHYLLKTTKSVRNAAAHNNCILNDLRPSRNKFNIDKNMQRKICNVSSSVHEQNEKRMSNQRIAQIITLLYTYNKIVTSNTLRKVTQENMLKLKDRFFKNIDFYKDNELILSNFNFLKQIFDCFEELV